MTKTVGITGTRNGCTELQHDTLSKRLYHLYNKRGYTHLVHGDCVGVDTQAHDIASTLGFKVIVLPPENEKLRAFSEGGTIHEPKPYLERNRNIVDMANIVIGVPSSGVSRGTSYTIHYAAKQNKPVYVIRPNGAISVIRKNQHV